MFDVFIMDLGGNDANVETLTQRFPHARVVRYYDNHLDTLKRCISRCRTPYAWVISSVCDYTAFDFDYRARPWEAYQLHCWASGEEKFGDTFLVNVAEFNRQKDIELLEWYKDVNWHTPGVPRIDPPVVTYTCDDLVDVVRATKFDTPYILFKRDVDSTPNFTPILWKNRAVHTFNRANSVSLVPREISGSLDSQIYDFPHVIKQKTQFLATDPLDIIYISNGEPDAERWYNHLLATVSAGNHTNWIRRVVNVNGRAKAYKAAAAISQTPWFFAVFAKLEVADSFDWLWQPDYLQEPKHYIFHSKNPVNGLEYGHMGVIAYNRRLVLDTDEHGLDFTLSKPHAVVPVLSATAHYNTTPELTWRTAFREVIKLKNDVERNDSVESQYRLNTWLHKANGDHAEWSLVGAHDAVEYYDAVEGNYDKLLLSFEWVWLREYWSKRYS
jgi:hypothetical protein